VTRDLLTDELRAFLRENVHSYEELETLLLLYRQREGRWSIDSVAAELRLPDTLAAAALGALQARGWIQSTSAEPEKFWYDAAKVSDETVASLARAYTEARFAVVEVMSANALTRLRSSAIRTFAEAFRLRGPKKNG